MRCSNYWVVVALVALAGCATGYAPRSIWNIGGYSETKIAPDSFRVRFDANEHLAPDQGADFARLRAAELCLAERKPFMRLTQFQDDLEYGHGAVGRFEVLPKDASSDTSGRNEATETLKRTVFHPGEPRYRSKSHLTVTCDDEDVAGALNAATLAESLRARYRLEGETR